MGEFRMPSLGADMVAGTLTEWYKHPGDGVRRGDIIAAVDTDKGSIDVEIFEDGVLERVVVPEGQKVPVGTLLAVIRSSGEAMSAPVPIPATVPAAPSAEAPTAAAPVPIAPPEPPGARLRVSPLARRLAAERGVDLATIRGSGAGGTILREDIEAAAGPGDRPARMRRAIAAAMARSKREIPHFYLTSTLDFGPASAWLARWNGSRRSACSRPCSCSRPPRWRCSSSRSSMRDGKTTGLRPPMAYILAWPHHSAAAGWSCRRCIT
jgi:pyruvate dehydrogenase E2 component (dihydrolipoamide acetyltransferase)